MRILENKQLANGLASLLIVAFSFSNTTKAQPSGGPYGPIKQTYEIPKTTGVIYYVAPDGKKEEQGLSLDKPTTIESAIQRAKTGDVIIVRGGIYRTGSLLLNQGITIQPYADEHPVFKGTYVAKEWKDLKNGTWSVKWEHLFPSKPDTWWNRAKYIRETPLHRFNNDMVFVNGKFLQSVGQENEVDKNTFYVDYEAGMVYIGIDPTNKLVEITAFDRAIHRVTTECNGKTSDKKGFTLKGIDFMQYAYHGIEVDGKDPEAVSNEADHGKDVVGTLIENCSITFCGRVNVFLKGDKITLRHCKISESSTEGLYIVASNDVLLEKNIFSRNNIENITGYYPAAVKIFNQSYRVTCRDNLVTDLANSNGIWYDVGNVDGCFINNWVENVGDGSIKFNKNKTWPSQNGFFFEISKGVTCAGNVFFNCDQGIFILNSCGAKVYNNTFVNSTATFGRNERNPANDGTFGWHSGTGPDVDKRTGHVFSNNLMFSDARHERPMMFIWQPDTFYKRNYKPQLEKLENNVMVKIPSLDTIVAIYWTQAVDKSCLMAFQNFDSLKKTYPEVKDNNRFYTDINVFKSVELKQLTVLKNFPGNIDAGLVPANISALMNLPKKDYKFVGAYPPIK
ncbi:MAG TPA: right-handed parallel beta-helix repeat-containing protein [Bacteroidales bacterium]|nr:right-handed parallel beta-helix repeat-containing protein [Bacteroidales bacterium]